MIKGIKNLWKWKKVIWNDRWYDSYFLFKLLKFKLENMEYKFRKDGMHLNNGKDADKMKICILLLDRIIKDEYHDNIFRYHDKKWGEPELSWDEYDNENSILNITHKNVLTEGDKKQENKEFRILSKRESKMKQNDVNYLFKLFSKYILMWWD